MTERNGTVLAVDAPLSKPVRFERLPRENARLLPE
jgi:hypothetical protein